MTRSGYGLRICMTRLAFFFLALTTLQLTFLSFIFPDRRDFSSSSWKRSLPSGMEPKTASEPMHLPAGADPQQLTDSQ